MELKTSWSSAILMPFSTCRQKTTGAWCGHSTPRPDTSESGRRKYQSWAAWAAPQPWEPRCVAAAHAETHPFVEGLHIWQLVHVHVDLKPVLLEHCKGLHDLLSLPYVVQTSKGNRKLRNARESSREHISSSMGSACSKSPVVLPSQDSRTSSEMPACSRVTRRCNANAALRIRRTHPPITVPNTKNTPMRRQFRRKAFFSAPGFLFSA